MSEQQLPRTLVADLDPEAVKQTEEITGNRTTAETIVNRLTCLWQRQGLLAGGVNAPVDPPVQPDERRVTHWQPCDVHLLTANMATMVTCPDCVTEDWVPASRAEAAEAALRTTRATIREADWTLRMVNETDRSIPTCQQELAAAIRDIDAALSGVSVEDTEPRLEQATRAVYDAARRAEWAFPADGPEWEDASERARGVVYDLAAAALGVNREQSDRHG